MPMPNVFAADDFTMSSLTAAINKAPYKPNFLGRLGIFRETPISTIYATVEDKQGKLSLVPTAPRGSLPTAITGETRTTKIFQVPHLPLISTIQADDIQGIRAFGSETELESMAKYINDRLVSMRGSLETTHEYHRIGACKGTILDSDGATTIYNLFTEFGIAETTVAFDYAGDDIKTYCTEVIRAMADAMGGTPYDGIIGLCGNNFFDALVSHDSVKASYDRWRESYFLRVSQLGPEFNPASMAGFPYGDIQFYNYRGKIGDVDFITTTHCRFIATGAMDLFQGIIAPANFIETVNTRGQLIYAKMEPLEFDMGMKLHAQSNYLAMCNRPASLIKGTMANFPLP